MTLRVEVALALGTFAAGFWLVFWAAFGGAVGFVSRVRASRAGEVRLPVVVAVAFRTGAFVAGTDFWLTLAAVLRGALAALLGVSGAVTVRVVPYRLA